MKYSIKSFLSLLVTLGFLLSCAQTPQQIAEKTLALTKDSTVRLVSQAGKSITLGSGFFVDKDKIATNIHVVAQPGPVFAKLSEKETTLAVEGIVAFDVKNNLVILKLSGEGVPLPLGDSDAVQSGESVSVVGYPNDRYKAVTGTIDSIFKSDKWFGIKGTISKESSGAPVLNSKGQVIGITVGYGDDSDNYAIPSNALKALLAKTMPLEPLVEWRKRETIRAERHYSQGEQKSAAKDYKNAIVEFDKAIELNPEHVRAYYNRGLAKVSINDYVKAIDDYTSTIRIDSKHALAYFTRGRAKYNLGKSKTDNGNVAEAQQLYQAAIDDYTQAIQLLPNYAMVYNNRGWTKYNLGKSKAGQGNVAEAQNFYQEAIDDYTQAITIDLEHPLAYINRGFAKAVVGDIVLAQGNPGKARSLYQSGIADYFKIADANGQKSGLDSEKGRESTVRVMCWTGPSNGFPYGSGFFVDKDKIVTNIHVVAQPGPIFAKLMDKETIWEVVGVTAFDVEYDIVVLKLAGEGTPLPLGNSDTVQRGEPVVAVGYPGRKYKVSAGNVHGIRNSDKLLGTTAESAKGSSGGPVLNSKGEVIGIHTRSDYFSFAVPSNRLKVLLAQSGPPEPLAQWQNRPHIRAYAYHHEGEGRFNAGDYAKAIVSFDNTILQNPKHIRAYFWRGRAKYSLGKSKANQGDVAEAQCLFQAAIEDYTQAIKINPRAIALNNRGWTQHKFGLSKAGQGDIVEAQHLYQAAIDDYTHSIKIDSKYTFPYFYRGLTRRYLGQSKADQGNITEAQQLYKTAIEDYTQAIQLFPKYAMAYNNRGWVKYLIGKSKANQGNVEEAQRLYQAAIDDYTQAIKISPKHVLAYTNRGNAKKVLGQSDEAEKDFAKAKELESKK